MQFIDLAAQQRQRLQNGQTIREAVDCRIAAVLNHGRYILGPEVDELEATLAAYVGVELHCLASGTDALLIALMALGFSRRRGDHHPLFVHFHPRNDCRVGCDAGLRGY